MIAASPKAAHRWPAVDAVAALAFLAMPLGSCRDATGVTHESSRVVFIRDTSPDTLFVADPESGTIEQRIALPVSAVRVRVAPAGDRVVVISGTQFFVMKLDGSGVQQLGTNAVSAAWSPDGTRIAYVRSPGPELHIVNANGGGDILVPGAVPGGWDGISWSPDGERIAFEGMRGGTRTIYLIDSDGSNLWDLDALLPGPAIRATGEPSWSPDSRKLVFSRWRYDGVTTETRLWVATLANRDARQITSGGGTGDVRPAWSPRGTEITFLRFEGDRSDVFVIGPDGSRMRQLTATPGSKEEDPQWLPR